MDKTVYKIFRLTPQFDVKFLYHGVERNRFVPHNKWISATERMVRDGSNGREYTSGFHVFLTLKIANKYIKRFKNTKFLRVLVCYAKELRQKPTNKDVYLASQLYLPI